ncbi:YicC family protein [Candidatus Dependentiae bacterium]|nr:YicC family protein [Candidatus Dependentiae bacterium]
MLLSMTGYGSKTVVLPVKKGNRLSIFIEIKSINSRFFESICKLPYFLNAFELEINQNLKRKLIRGRVYLTVRAIEGAGILEKVNLSLKLVDEYLNAANLIKKKFNIPGNLNVSNIFDLPNILISEKEDVNSKFIKDIIKNIEIVADQVIESRQNEGKALQQDLEKRFTICASKINKIKILFKKLMEEQKNLISKILAQKEDDEEIENGKLEDLYSTLNKIDIHEEITRFNSHLTAIKEVIKDKNVENGKRIDFILQELVRESNTILAKCSNYNISSIVVDIKVELEKAREQSQNVV